MTLLPQNIRFLRKRLNLSQTAFAESVDMNRGNIASYEKGSAEPNTTKLLRIARFFGVSLHDLLENDLAASWGTGEKPAGAPPRMPTSTEATEALEKVSRIEKMYSGIRDLYEYQQTQAPNPSAYSRLSSDHERLLELMEELILMSKNLFGQNENP